MQIVFIVVCTYSLPANCGQRQGLTLVQCCS